MPAREYVRARESACVRACERESEWHDLSPSQYVPITRVFESYNIEMQMIQLTQSFGIQFIIIRM